MDQHQLTNDHLTIETRALGASLNRMIAHTPTGDVDLVLGHADDADRPTSTYYLGEVVGPVANRIAGGRFTLDGVEHRLVPNDRGNTLHGGPAGFSTRYWTLEDATTTSTTWSLAWADPSGAHPGELEASITYTLHGTDLIHTITVTSDRPTLAAPCLHPYLNLAGQGTIEDHVLSVAADAVLFTDESQIPQGDPVDVSGTPFDLRRGVRLGDVLDSPHPQMTPVAGFDHAFVLQPSSGPAATLTDTASGRRLDLWTDQPSLQVFTGVGLSGDTPGLTGTPYPDRGGVALEAQMLPNAANRPDFGRVRIDPEHPSRSTTRWRVTV